MDYLAAKKLYDDAQGSDWKCEEAECIATLTGWQAALDALKAEVATLSFSKSFTYHSENEIKSSTDSSFTFISKDQGCIMRYDDNDMKYYEFGGELYDVTVDYSIENGVLDWRTTGDDCDISYYTGTSDSIIGTWDYTGSGSIAELNDACDYLYPDDKIMNITASMETDGELLQLDSRIEYNCLVDDVLWEMFADQESDPGEGGDIIIDCNSWFQMDKQMKITTIREYHETTIEVSNIYALNGKSCTESDLFELTNIPDEDCSFTSEDRAFNDCMQDMLGGYCESIAPDDRPYACDQYSKGYYDNATWL